MPEHGLVRLLELRKEDLEIVEVQIDRDSPVAGKRVAGLPLPEGSRLISVMRNGTAEIAVGSTVLRPGDQVLAILQPGKEDELRAQGARSALRSKSAQLRASTTGVREDDDRDQLEPAEPHQAGHDDAREVAERLERAHRPGEAEPGADVAERRRRPRRSRRARDSSRPVRAASIASSVAPTTKIPT